MNINNVLQQNHLNDFVVLLFIDHFRVYFRIQNGKFAGGKQYI